VIINLGVLLLSFYFEVAEYLNQGQEEKDQTGISMNPMNESADKHSVVNDNDITSANNVADNRKEKVEISIHSATENVAYVDSDDEHSDESDRNGAYLMEVSDGRSKEEIDTSVNPLTESDVIAAGGGHGGSSGGDVNNSTTNFDGDDECDSDDNRDDI